MIRHLVLFRMRSASGAERVSQVTGMRERLERLPDVVPGVLSLVVRQDVVGGGEHWDAALTADIRDRAALDSYQGHPDHRAAIDWMASFVTERAVADIELGEPVGA